jgi:hypothetical protein
VGEPAILFFGPDECLRVEVLRQAGLKVTHCSSVAELARAIQESQRAQAIVFAEERGKRLDEALQVAKERTTAARVLFQPTWTVSNERDFDLVVYSGTAPESWLADIARTVVQKRGSALEKPAVMGKGWREIARELQSMRKRRSTLNDDSDPPAQNLRGIGRIQP